MKTREELQESQYSFPYHYTPYFDSRGVARRFRYLKWGFEYLCYQHHLVGRVRELKPRSVLEVGCGDGYFIGALGAEISERMGIDVSGPAIEFGRAFHHDVVFKQASLEKVQGTFDLVAAIEVLEHIPDEQVTGFLRDCWDRVGRGGHLLLCVPTTVVPCHAKHYRHYNLSMLSAQCVAAEVPIDFTLVEYLYGPPPWIEFLLRMTCNRHIAVEIAMFNKWVWQYIWSRRISNETSGRHLAVIAKKG